jgi:hypothetical protein
VIKSDYEIGGECGTYGGGKTHTEFWCGNKERDHLACLGVDWRIIAGSQSYNI